MPQQDTGDSVAMVADKAGLRNLRDSASSAPVAYLHDAVDLSDYWQRIAEPAYRELGARQDRTGEQTAQE